MTIPLTRLVVCLSLAFLCCTMRVAAQDRPPQRDVTEKHLVQIDFSLWITEIFAVSPDSQHVAYGAHAGRKQFVIVDGQAGKSYQVILGSMLRFSPNSQRLAYAAQEERQSFVVIDGKALKSYDGLGAGTLRFSPDSQRLAYVPVPPNP